MDLESLQGVSEQRDLCQALSEGAANDPFRKLPPEIIAEIFTLLPGHSIVNIKIASPYFRKIPLSNLFWRKRIESAMPYLWDLPRIPNLNDAESIDWRQVYLDLSSRGRGTGKGKILGLVNRHMIWSDWRPALEAWFKTKAIYSELHIQAAIQEWTFHRSFREWRLGRGQDMAGHSLVYGQVGS